MAPKSATKKEKPLWWNCEKCQTYLPTSELTKHQEANCTNIGTLSGYVSAGDTFHCRKVEVGTLVTLEEVKRCTDAQRYRLVTLPLSVMRKLGLMLGDYVEISLSRNGTPVGTIVRVVWPVEDRTGTKIALEALDEFDSDKSNELIASVTAIDPSKLEDAQEISLRLEDPEDQGKVFNKNGQFLVSCLKHQLQGSVVIRENQIALKICNKMFAFRIVNVRTVGEGDTVTEQLNRMSLQDRRMFVVLRTTKLVVLDNAQMEQEIHQNQRYALERIGALDGIITELRTLMDAAFSIETRKRHGPISRGVLLYGVSGVGKTMLVNALAAHYRCHVVRLNCSEVYSKFYGESEANVSRQFSEVFEVHPKPALVIVEELHNLCPKASSSDIGKRISQHFLNLLDSLHSSARGNRSLVIGTTDNVDNVNALLRRGGRLDYEFELPVPDAAGRESILQRVLSRATHSLSSEEIRSIARITHGYVGADLENLVANAAGGTAGSSTIDSQALLTATQHVKASAMREIMIECPNIRWTDIGGQEELKHKLRQIIDWPIHHPEVFTRLGIKPPRGLLMFGPPGCSKTMIAKAIATESRLNFLSIKGSQLFSMWVGESERAVRDLFRRARQVAPSIIFFDEIDAIGGERSGDGGSGGSSVKERVLAQLLTEMDGVSVLKDVRIVAATNRPDLIDRALMRPGRLDRIVYVRLPDEAAREEIFRIKLKTIPTAADVDLQELVRRSVGCSGSEIEAICQEAALRGLEGSFDVQTINWSHFEHALQLVRPRTSPDLLRLYDDYLKQHQ
ncbi:ATPase family protein 2 homolog [Anopheles darlingi]|uniref:ATPase family protein 2 homolog n=1 Tax=Anopheles darlingi TaxID=43151 RepID=UPI0021002B2F|nr:ATPase family protein 2 homolog [Anopheles darlingi]